MYRVSENGHSSFLPSCLFSEVYAFGTNFASIRVGSVGCPFLQQNGAEVRQPAKTSTDKQKTKDMDREIPKEVRNKERNKKIIRYGGMGAAGIVVVSLLISLMRAGVKEKDLVFSQVSRGTIEVSVSASGKVVPAFEEKALVTVFSEPPVDTVFEETFELGNAKTFSVEYLPGQFDQRADSAEQCVKLLNEEEEPVIRTATTYVIEGEVTEEQLEAIKHHCINPVDSRETGLEKPETLVQDFEEPADVASFDGFQTMQEAELKELYSSLNLAMTFKDFLHIQKYFKNEEHRDPSVTEIRVLDTYWSDHCRHTTFSTELKDVLLSRKQSEQS